MSSASIIFVYIIFLMKKMYSLHMSMMIRVYLKQEQGKDY